MLKSQNGKKAFSTKPASQDLGQQDNNDTVLAGTLYTVLCHTGHVSLHDTGEFLKSAHGLVRKTVLNGVKERRRKLRAEVNSNQKAENSGIEGCWDLVTAPHQAHPTQPPEQKGHEGSFITTHSWAWHCAPAILGTPVGQSWEQLPIDWCRQCQLYTTTT